MGAVPSAKMEYNFEQINAMFIQYVDASSDVSKITLDKEYAAFKSMGMMLMGC